MQAEKISRLRSHSSKIRFYLTVFMRKNIFFPVMIQLQTSKNSDGNERNFSTDLDTTVIGSGLKRGCNKSTDLKNPSAPKTGIGYPKRLQASTAIQLPIYV